MSDRIQNTNANFLTVLVCLILAAVAVAVFLPGLMSPQRTARKMAVSTPLRGIHQSMVMYAQSNKVGGRDGYFPGLDAIGTVLPDGIDTGHSGDGLLPAARMWILLENKYLTPEYVIAPADSHKTEAVNPDGGFSPVTHGNFSYAMLALTPGSIETEEWKETFNTSAVVMGDRAIGSSRANISSIWTTPGRGEWHGGVVKNDNSVSHETTQDAINTQYGPASPTPTVPKPAALNPIDDIFHNDPTAADAFLVHEDATTAYSAR